MTNSSTSSKRLASNHFGNGDYASCFKELWSLGVDEFVSYATKSYYNPRKNSSKLNWLAHKGSGRFFWSAFILEPDTIGLLESPHGPQLLHNYYQLYGRQESKFEEFIAKKFPSLFVQAIRVNQIFLKPDRLDLLANVSLPENLEIHQTVWVNIHNLENKIWNQIELFLNQVVKLSLADILCDGIIWIESNRFKDNSQHRLNALAATYSLFIELIDLNHPEANRFNMNSDNLGSYFIKKVVMMADSVETSGSTLVNSFMEQLVRWFTFKKSILSPYSYDDSIEPEQVDELVVLSSNPESYYKWLTDGVRYQLNQFRYTYQGIESVDFLESEKEIQIPGETDELLQQNRKLADVQIRTLNILKDLERKNIRVNRSNEIPATEILSPLQTYSFNRYLRYELPMVKLFENVSTWREAFLQLTVHSLKTGIEVLPFLLLTPDEYVQVSTDAIPGLSKDKMSIVQKLFSFKRKTNGDFDRFQLKYDVWRKPFYQIGTYLFCPTYFFANNDWFYSFVQVALRQKHNKKDSNKMEERLANSFRRLGWKTKVTSENEANLMPGDIDLIVEDGKTVLYIQLKSTYFRLNLKDKYSESINRDLHAANQLNSASAYFSKPNPVYQTNLRTIKWIVSTSYENISGNVSDCVKVNYFDLLYCLDNFDIHELSDLVNLLESDLPFKSFVQNARTKEIPVEAKDLFNDALNQLEVFGEDKYRKVLLSNDERKTLAYNELFQAGINLEHKGDKRGALEKYNDCAALRPNDAEVYGAIANVHADLQEFNLAFDFFDRALKLLPNDPFIKRNYSIALMQSGRLMEGMNMVLDLIESFPVLGDLRNIFEQAWKDCVHRGLLKTEDILKIKERWNELN